MIKRIILYVSIITFWFCLPMTAYGESKSYTYNDIDEYLERSVKSSNLPGMSVIIVDKDSVLFSNTYGNCENIETPFIIGSLSKSFTALAIMQLVERDLVSLDKEISTYLPNIKDGDKITVKQLLNQTSGLGEYQRLKNMKITDTYETHQYANVNYDLLGEIVEAVSGISYDAYVTENIFKPLKMNRSAASLRRSKENGLIEGYRNYFGIQIAGEPDYPDENSWSHVSAGYISSSASDMGKYLQMYLKGGENIISEESIHKMFYDNVYVESNPPHYYGMGWVLTEDNEEPILNHTGLVENYMANMLLLPESGIGLVFLVNTNDYLVTNNMMSHISDSVVRMLMDQAPIIINSQKYLTTHLLLDGVYLILLLTALIPLLLLLRRAKKKLMSIISFRTFLSVGVLNLVLPTAFLLLPRILHTPLWAIRYYVPDLFIVLVTSASMLYVGGIIKLVLILRKYQLYRHEKKTMV